LCREGRRSLVRFVQERGLRYRRCGKVIVAVHPSELRRLHDLLERGRANGLHGLEEIGPDRLREVDPNMADSAPCSFRRPPIVDFAALARALAAETWFARLVVTCAGLQSEPGRGHPGRPGCGPAGRL